MNSVNTLYILHTHGRYLMIYSRLESELGRKSESNRVSICQSGPSIIQNHRPIFIDKAGPMEPYRKLESNESTGCSMPHGEIRNQKSESRNQISAIRNPKPAEDENMDKTVISHRLIRDARASPHHPLLYDTYHILRHHHAA